MIYPKKISAKKSDLIIKIAVLSSIIISIILIMINKLTTPNISWSELCISGIIYTFITVKYSINKNINIAGHTLIQTIIVSCLLVYIDYNIDYTGWSFSIAVPIVLIIANITMLILSIVSYKKFLRYAIYQLVIVIISLVPIVLIAKDLLTSNIMSIIASSISVLNFGISIILCAKDILDEVKRKFHI